MWPESFTLLSLLVVAGIGLFAGMVGGMLGVGGSVIMIPGLVLVFGQERTEGMSQHLYQAAAMAANVAVAIPAAMRHHRSGTMRPHILKWMLAGALVFVVIGVAASNLPVFRGVERGVWLGRLLALFLLYVAYVNVQSLLMRPKAGQPDTLEVEPETVPRTGSAGVGAVMGTFAGLLGIGGGAIAVPLQQTFLKLPLRTCIANSSAVICVSAGLGTIYKHATLGQHGLDWRISLIVAAALAPTAWIGGRLGASLTHRLPLRQVRIAFVAFMFVAAWRMAAWP